MSCKGVLRVPLRGPWIVLLGLLALNPLPAAAAGPAELVDHYRANAQPLATGALLRGNIRWHGQTKARDFLSLQQYKETRRGVVALLRKHRPGKYRYIGLGRSPTAVVAFLQNLGLEAINLPGSGLSSTQVSQAAWDQHLAQVLPPSFLASDKKIVIFDRVSSGASLEQAANALSAYLRSQGSSAEVALRAFVSRSRHPQHAQSNIDLDRYPELDAMNHYSHWAEYPNFTIGKDSVQGMGSRPEYSQFKTVLLERMKRDKALSKRIKRFNTPHETSEEP